MREAGKGVPVPNVFAPPLVRAGIINRSRSMSFPELPIGGTMDQAKKIGHSATLSGENNPQVRLSQS